MEKVQMFLIQKMTQKRMVKGNDYEVFTVVTLLLYICCKREIFCYKGLNKCLPDFVFYFNFLFFILFFAFLFKVLEGWWDGIWLYVYRVTNGGFQRECFSLWGFH